MDLIAHQRNFRFGPNDSVPRSSVTTKAHGATGAVAAPPSGRLPGHGHHPGAQQAATHQPSMYGQLPEAYRSAASKPGPHQSHRPPQGLLTATVAGRKAAAAVAAVQAQQQQGAAKSYVHRPARGSAAAGSESAGSGGPQGGDAPAAPGTAHPHVPVSSSRVAVSGLELPQGAGEQHHADPLGRAAPPSMPHSGLSRGGYGDYAPHSDVSAAVLDDAVGFNAHAPDNAAGNAAQHSESLQSRGLNESGGDAGAGGEDEDQPYSSLALSQPESESCEVPIATLAASAASIGPDAGFCGGEVVFYQDRLKVVVMDADGCMSGPLRIAYQHMHGMSLSGKKKPPRLSVTTSLYHVDDWAQRHGIELEFDDETQHQSSKSHRENGGGGGGGDEDGKAKTRPSLREYGNALIKITLEITESDAAFFKAHLGAHIHTLFQESVSRRTSMVPAGTTASLPMSNSYCRSLSGAPPQLDPTTTAPADRRQHHNDQEIAVGGGLATPPGRRSGSGAVPSRRSASMNKFAATMAGTATTDPRHTVSSSASAALAVEANLRDERVDAQGIDLGDDRDAKAFRDSRNRALDHPFRLGRGRSNTVDDEGQAAANTAARRERHTTEMEGPDDTSRRGDATAVTAPKKAASVPAEVIFDIPTPPEDLSPEDIAHEEEADEGEEEDEDLSVVEVQASQPAKTTSTARLQHSNNAPHKNAPIEIDLGDEAPDDSTTDQPGVTEGCGFGAVVAPRTSSPKTVHRRVRRLRMDDDDDDFGTLTKEGPIGLREVDGAVASVEEPPNNARCADEIADAATTPTATQLEKKYRPAGPAGNTGDRATAGKTTGATAGAEVHLSQKQTALAARFPVRPGAVVSATNVALPDSLSLTPLASQDAPTPAKKTTASCRAAAPGPKTASKPVAPSASSRARAKKDYSAAGTAAAAASKDTSAGKKKPAPKRGGRNAAVADENSAYGVGGASIPKGAGGFFSALAKGGVRGRSGTAASRQASRSLRTSAIVEAFLDGPGIGLSWNKPGAKETTAANNNTNGEHDDDDDAAVDEAGGRTKPRRVLTAESQPRPTDQLHDDAPRRDNSKDVEVEPSMTVGEFFSKSRARDPAPSIDVAVDVQVPASAPRSTKSVEQCGVAADRGSEGVAVFDELDDVTERTARPSALPAAAPVRNSLAAALRGNKPAALVGKGTTSTASLLLTQEPFDFEPSQDSAAAIAKRKKQEQADKKKKQQQEAAAAKKKKGGKAKGGAEEEHRRVMDSDDELLDEIVKTTKSNRKATGTRDAQGLRGKGKSDVKAGTNSDVQVQASPAKLGVSIGTATNARAPSASFFSPSKGRTGNGNCAENAATAPKMAHDADQLAAGVDASVHQHELSVVDATPFRTPPEAQGSTARPHKRSSGKNATEAFDPNRSTTEARPPPPQRSSGESRPSGRALDFTDNDDDDGVPGPDVPIDADADHVADVAGTRDRKRTSKKRTSSNIDDGGAAAAHGGDMAETDAGEEAPRKSRGRRLSTEAGRSVTPQKGDVGSHGASGNAVARKILKAVSHAAAKIKQRHETRVETAALTSLLRTSSVVNDASAAAAAASTTAHTSVKKPNRASKRPRDNDCDDTTGDLDERGDISDKDKAAAKFHALLAHLITNAMAAPTSAPGQALGEDGRVRDEAQQQQLAALARALFGTVDDGFDEAVSFAPPQVQLPSLSASSAASKKIEQCLRDILTQHAQHTASLVQLMAQLAEGLVAFKSETVEGLGKDLDKAEAQLKDKFLKNAG